MAYFNILNVKELSSNPLNVYLFPESYTYEVANDYLKKNNMDDFLVQTKLGFMAFKKIELHGHTFICIVDSRCRSENLFNLKDEV